MRIKVRVDGDSASPDCITAAIQYVIGALFERANEVGVALDWSALDVWARRSLIRRDYVISAKAPELSWLDDSLMRASR